MRYLAPILCLLVASCGRPYDAPVDHEGRCFNIPVVDEGSLSGRPQQGQQAQQGSQATSAPSGTTQAPAAAPASDAKATVREYMRKLMDETRVVPDTAAKKGGPRGSPGSFDKLNSAEVEQFVAAIIKGAELFLPKSLTDQQRWALVCAEISIESAFTPNTSGVNPGNADYVSVGPLQLTLAGKPGIPGMWDDIFRQYANLPGLTHFDGSPWDTKSTSNDALKTNIYDGIIASLYCITEQGRRGCPDWFGGPDGPMPKTMRTAYLAWVIGGPALKSGGDLDGQRDMYIASIETDLKLLGFPISLIDSAF